jgi:hypothetical protein
MLKIPDAKEFGTNSEIPEKMTQTDWLKQVKNIGCIGCHQLGQLSTRTIPAAFGEFKWDGKRGCGAIQSGQSGEMTTSLRASSVVRRSSAIVDRPHCQGRCPTPSQAAAGVGAAIVVTTWVGGRRNNASTASSPRTRKQSDSQHNDTHSRRNTAEPTRARPGANTVSFFNAPVRDVEMPGSLGPGHAASIKPLAPYAYWGDEKVWDTRANSTTMIDEKGRVWLAATGAEWTTPRSAERLDHPSAKIFLLEKRPAGQPCSIRDDEAAFVDTCFATHHLRFGYDAPTRVVQRQVGRRLAQHQLFDGVGDAARHKAGRLRSRHKTQQQTRRLFRPQRASGSCERQTSSPARVPTS